MLIPDGVLNFRRLLDLEVWFFGHIEISFDSAHGIFLFGGGVVERGSDKLEFPGYLFVAVHENKYIGLYSIPNIKYY